MYIQYSCKDCFLWVFFLHPMHAEDDSYVEDESNIQDYLLSDVGTIWRGTCRRKLAMKWEYGQVNQMISRERKFLLVCPMAFFFFSTSPTLHNIKLILLLYVYVYPILFHMPQITVA